MTDEQIILNYYLFISLLEKKNVYEKKLNVLRCLEQGADVNAVDRNQCNNTPLHIAVEKDEMVIIQLLLYKGAATYERNQDSKTPLDMARELETESGKHIFELLQDPYFKRRHRILYEVQLFSLVLIRALNDKDIQNFKMANDMYGAGCLDDICLRFNVKGQGKPITMFLDIMYGVDHLLTVKSVRKEKGYLKDREPLLKYFHLLKYFDSYKEIKSNFERNDHNVMFNGEFSDIETNLIIYSQAKEQFTRKLVRRTKPSVKVHELINTALNEEPFQLDAESVLESLTKMTIQDQIRKLVKIFLDYIMNIKYKPELLMLNEYIARYHYVLSRDVITVSEIHEIKVNQVVKQIRYGTFRSEFFTNSSEHILYFREILYNLISSDGCDPYLLEYDNFISIFQDILENPNAINISRVIGKLMIYKTPKLEIIHWHYLIRKCNKRETALKRIRDELSKLEVQSDIIREAVWLKLRGMIFYLPPQIGNLDMYFIGTENEIKNSLTNLVENLMQLFRKCNESKVVEINKTTAGNRKLIKRSLTDEEGGLESAVGNLLVLDENTKMFKFDVDKELPKYSKAFLCQLLLHINIDELRKYKLNINIDNFPKYLFDDDQCDKNQIKEFLDRLWFYTDQANESEVETILKYEIRKYYNNQTRNKKSLFKIHTDAIYLEALDTIQKWRKSTSVSYFLDNKSQIFMTAKDTFIDSPMLTVLNYIFIQKLQKLDITFNQAAVDCLSLRFTKNRLNIITDAIILTALKINQHFQEDLTFIEFNNILSLSVYDYNYLIRDLRVTKIKYLIVIYEEIKCPERHAKSKLKQVMDEFIGKNIIVISKHNLADENSTLEGENFVSVSDCNNYLIDLTEDSQKVIVENSEVVFHDDEISIKPTIRWTSDNSPNEEFDIKCSCV